MTFACCTLTFSLTLCALLRGYGSEVKCEGSQCPAIPGDDNVLLQTRTQVWNIDNDSEEGSAKAGGNKKCGWVNMKLGTVSQSSTCWSRVASKAIQGDTKNDWRNCAYTCKDKSTVQWWKFDSYDPIDVQKVKVLNRGDSSRHYKRLQGFEVYVDGQKCATEDGSIGMGENKEVPCVASGSEIKIKQPSKDYLTICEVAIFGCQEVPDYSYTIGAAEATAAQFLMKTTFGPTRAGLTELATVGSSKKWVQNQMALPFASHRQYYRERVNPYFDPSTMNENTHSYAKREGGFQWHGKSPCAEGSRWANYVITRSDNKKELKVKDGKIFIGGVYRADIDPNAASGSCTDKQDWYLKKKNKQCSDPKWANYVRYRCYTESWTKSNSCQQSCFDRGRGRPGDDCSSGWHEGLIAKICSMRAGIGASIKLAPISATLSEETANDVGGPKPKGPKDPCDGTVQYMTNPVVFFSADDTVKQPTLSFADSTDVPDAIFLSAGTVPTCGLKDTDAIKYKGKYYVLDRRVDLKNNEPSNPSICAPRTFLNWDTCKVASPGGSCDLLCGTPGEAANVGKYGHQFNMCLMDFRDLGRDRQYDNKFVARPYSETAQPSIIWTIIGLQGEDQLRQRTAWALSQILVASAQGLGSRSSEAWTNYYDIFVRNAFGNFRDILQEVTNSPMMAGYLTYMGSRSYDSSKTYPDENYAREIMQLFTIGLETLNDDGSIVKDAQNHTVETYTNENIMYFARVMTGYDTQSFRWNYERKYKGAGGNYIDALNMRPHYHDKYPKPDLHGNYIGDGKPLCSDLPGKSFLAKGARYEFQGYSIDSKQLFHELAATSALFGKLCPGGAGSCDYKAAVILDASVTCHSKECQLANWQSFGGVVKVDGAYYAYVPPTCVHLFFSGQQRIVHSRVSRWKKCADADVLAAGFACCKGCTDDPHPWMKRKGMTCTTAETKWVRRGKPRMFDAYCAKSSSWRRRKYCQMTCWTNSPKYDNKLAYAGDDCSGGAYKEEAKCASASDKTTFESAKAFCQSKQMDLCTSIKTKCGENKKGDYLWKDEQCPVQATIHADGKVSGYTDKDANKFTVQWLGASPGKGGEQAVTVEIVEVFSKVPSKDKLVEKLKIGAFPPSTACSHSCTGDVKGYATNDVIDKNTIFEYNGLYFKNAEAQVTLATGEKFRNPPVFLKGAIGRGWRQSRAALAEVDAFLDHLFYHPNTPVNIGKKLIQRFDTSNPAPDYIKAVAEAFKTGTYEGIGSSKYGDLGATVAAILLYDHPQGKKTDGLLREPLLKFMNLVRAVEFTDAYPIFIRKLHDTIGQMPYNSPTVFNFYDAQYMPSDFGNRKGGILEPEPEPEPLLAPEFQIFTPPWAINLLNGLMRFIRDGLSYCDSGFGNKEGGLYQDLQHGCTRGTVGLKEMATPQDTLKQLDILLTGGRLTSMDQEIVADAYHNAMKENDGKIKAAERAIMFTPEFHTYGDPKPKGLRPDEVPKKHVAKVAYKAVVNMFWHGGADTYQMLVPRDCKLHDDYAAMRKGMDLKIKQLIALKDSKTQKCKKFGVHPGLTEVAKMFNAGELAFIANIGTLKSSTNRAGIRGGGYKLCPSQFSHSHAQAAAQTLQCQALTSAKGIGGKIADNLETKHNYKSSSFSLAGISRYSEGDETHVDVLDYSSGVKTLKDYAEVKDIIHNVTHEIYENVFAEEYGRQFKFAVERSNSLSKYLAGAADAVKNYGTVGTKLEKQFLQVARTIATHKARNAERDFFFVQLGGWDMHSGVVEGLDSKFAEVDKALAAFVKNLKSQNIWNSVVVTTESDFGRTLSFNGAGTDHGWGGNHLILGGAINGGEVYNDFLETYQPGSEWDSGRGRVIPKYPWESVMVPVAQWMGVKDESLDEIFPNRKNFNSSVIIPKETLFKS